MTLVELARRLRPYIEKAAQSLTDTEALQAVELYPEWTVGMAYAIDLKLRRHGKLYRVLQGHTAMVGWEPEKTPALYVEINETHSGTLDDPIPYEAIWRWRAANITFRAEWCICVHEIRLILYTTP